MSKEFLARFGLDQDIVKTTLNGTNSITADDIVILGTKVDNIVFALQDGDSLSRVVNQFILSSTNVTFEKDVVVNGDIIGDGANITNITGTHIKTGTITTDQIANGAVTSEKLGTNIAITGTLTTGGNVGIGTTDPTEKLHVNGNIFASGRAQFGSVSIFETKITTPGNLLFLNGEGENLFVIRDDKSAKCYGKFLVNDSVSVDYDYLYKYGPVAASDFQQATNNGVIDVDTQQPLNSLSTKFVQAPWMYTYAIESPGERATGSTLITLGGLGENGKTYGDIPMAYDTINMITNGASRLHINPSGNVGIGTTAPTSKLHVVGGDIVTDNRLIVKTGVQFNGPLDEAELNNIISSTAGSMTIASEAWVNIIADTNSNNNDTTQPISMPVANFLINGNNSEEATRVATIDRCGNYIATFHTDQHSTQNNVITHIGRMDGLDANPTVDNNFNYSGMKIMVSSNRDENPNANNNHCHLGFYTWGYDVGGSSEKMRIRSDGNVGIGTINPTAKLHIEGKMKIQTNIQNGALPDQNALYIYDCDPSDDTVKNQARTNPLCLALRTQGQGQKFISFDRQGILGWCVGQDSTDGEKFKIANNWADLQSATAFTISGGNVGIGTTTPTAKLDVAGNINCTVLKCTSNTTATFGVNWYFDQTYGTLVDPNVNMSINWSAWLHHSLILGGGIFQLSDDRLKTDEIYIDSILDDLCKIKPQFYFKHTSFESAKANDKTEGCYEVGVMAQELFYNVPKLRHLVTIPNTANENIYKHVDTNTGNPTIDPDYSDWGEDSATVNYLGFVPYLIKAISELNDKNAALENKVAEQNTALEAKVAVLETSLAAKDAVIADLIARIEKLEGST